MEGRAKNPIRGAYKCATDTRNIREAVKRQNEGHKRQARAMEVQKRRKIDEVEEEVKAPKVDKRREQLIAWKLERDRKRQFETKKKSFVVKHVNYSPTKYLVSSANKRTTRKQAALENQTCSRRITRSYAKNCAKSEEMKRGNKNLTATKKPTQLRSKKGKSENLNKDEKACTKAEPIVPESKSSETGFVFSFNQDDMLPKTFKFSKNSPASNFVLKESKFNDPIAKFNESIKNENENSRNGSKDIFDFTSNDVIAKFNEAVKIDNGTEKDVKRMGSFLTSITVDPIEKFNSSLKDESKKEQTDQVMHINKPSLTPIKADKQCKEPSDSKMEDLSEKQLLKGHPGKTPKKPSALPSHMLEEIGGGSFTPRRIQSTAHFRNLVNEERQKLGHMNNLWSSYLDEQELTGSLSEDVTGLIRSVIGKSQLLIDQRFKQFEDLISLHQSHKAEQGATASDLQGFWDMVNYQVEDVNNKFAELETLKLKNWVKEKPKRTLKPKKAAETKKNISAKVSSRQEEVRKFKEAMRAKMESLKSESEATLEKDEEIENKENKVSPVMKTPVRRSIRKTPSKNMVRDNESDDLWIKPENHIALEKNEETEVKVDKVSPVLKTPVRRSTRKTPSKNKMPEDENDDLWIKIESDVTLRNIEAAEDKENNISPAMKTPVRRSIRKTPAKKKTPGKVEDPGFLKYLRPSVSEDNEDDLFGLGFGSPVKRMTNQSILQSTDVSLIKFD
ncbi:disks large-associated protein 5-like isoform X2 [Rhopilema esculentum]|uniref:disks large-associated protein 5-like isoform X2 n=1 Tax=Rhopilema esculentum TaxID=499914 RepID=UPI0031DE1618